MRILIIEDGLEKIIAIKRVMLEMGIQDYKIAKNKEDAQEIYMSDYKIDIVILDMKFPEKANSSKECSGMEMLNQIEEDYRKAHYTPPKVIIYSLLLLEKVYKEHIPKSFAGQAITAGGVKDLLKQLI